MKVCGCCGRQFFKEDDFLLDTSRWRVCDRGHLWFNCGCGSTNMIEKGRYPWYKPEEAMSPGAGNLFNKVPALKQLPHIPATVMELQKVLEDENATSARIAAAAKGSPIIAANILKIASHRVTTGVRITSLEHAVSYLGFTGIGDIVITASLQEFSFTTLAFQPAKFWESSLLCGSVGEFLAREYDAEVSGDVAFIAASLCNIGKVVGAICFPETTDRIFNSTMDVRDLQNWSEGEKKHQAYDHSILGEIGAVFWGFPEFVLDAVMTHHRLPEGFDDPYCLSHIVALANQVTHWLELCPSRMDNELLHQLRERMGIAEAELSEIVDELSALNRDVSA